MTRLLRVEAGRIASRRLVRLFLLLAALGIVIGATTTFLRSHSLSEEDRRAAVAQGEAQRRADLEDCSAHFPESDVQPGLTVEEYCDEHLLGPPESYVIDPGYRLTDADDATLGLSILLTLLLGFLGASMIGAEWQAGTITTLLTWEPRRIRVLVAKASAVAAFAFIASVLLQALLGLTLLPSALLRGTTEGADAAWLRTTVGTVLRGGVLAMLAALGGLAVASIARNTAFAIGAAFAWLAVLEPILLGLRPHWQRWFLSPNAAAFLLGHPPDGAEPARSTIAAGLLVSLYVGAVALTALAAFRSRDVT